MCWWSLFRMVTLFHLLSSSEHSQAHEESQSVQECDMTTSFWGMVGVQPKGTSEGPAASSSMELPKPVCTAGQGCDRPLYCFNYSSWNATNHAAVGGHGNRTVVKVTGYELQGILEDPSITNTCAVVMIYAPWCPYSADFARQFNALGRSYRELPVFALDISESDM